MESVSQSPKCVPHLTFFSRKLPQRTDRRGGLMVNTGLPNVPGVGGFDGHPQRGAPHKPGPWRGLCPPSLRRRPRSHVKGLSYEAGRALIINPFEFAEAV